ncbi:MAG: hypothetical protein UHN88_03545, partial [Eubacterium sp.]|nr:hypothetical protein [Eubacterium sp.]
MNDKNSRLLFPICVILSAAGIIAMIAACVSKEIWVDEAFTLRLIGRSYGDIVHLTAADVHPPLYYFITKFCVDAAHRILPGIATVMLAKAASVIPIILLWILGVTIIRRSFGRITAGLWLVLLIAIPKMQDCGVLIRMYGWAMLFVTLAFLSAYAILMGKNFGFLPLILMSLAAGYTHYFALVAVAFAYLALLIIFLVRDRKRLILWLIASVITIAAYFPWLTVFLRQASAVKESYWIAPVTAASVLEYLAYTTVTLPLLILPVIALILNIRGRHTEAQFSVILILVPYFVILVGVTASILIRPVFVSRYITPAEPCLWLGILIAFRPLLEQKRFVRTTVMIAATAGALATTLLFARDEIRKADSFRRLDALRAESGDKVAFISDHLHPERILRVAEDCPSLTWRVEEIEPITNLVYDGIGTLRDKSEPQAYLDAGYTLYYV